MQRRPCPLLPRPGAPGSATKCGSWHAAAPLTPCPGLVPPVPRPSVDPGTPRRPSLLAPAWCHRFRDQVRILARRGVLHSLPRPSAPGSGTKCGSWHAAASFTPCPGLVPPVPRPSADPGTPRRPSLLAPAWCHRFRDQVWILARRGTLLSLPSAVRIPVHVGTRAGYLQCRLGGSGGTWPWHRVRRCSLSGTKPRTHGAGPVLETVLVTCPQDPPRQGGTRMLRVTTHGAADWGRSGDLSTKGHLPGHWYGCRRHPPFALVAEPATLDWGSWPRAPQHFKIYLSGGTSDTGGGMCAWSLAGAGAGCDNRPGAAAPGRDRAVLETQDRGCTKGARIHPRPSRDTHSWATGQGHRSVSRSAEGAAPGTQGRGCRPRAEGRWPVTCECLQRTARLPYPGPPRT